MDFQDLKNSEVKQYLLANADWVCEVCGDYNSDCCAKHILSGRKADVMFVLMKQLLQKSIVLIA